VLNPTAPLEGCTFAHLTPVTPLLVTLFVRSALRRAANGLSLEWQTYLSSLERIEGYPRESEEYLMALATCYKAYRRKFSLPDVVFPWEKAAETISPSSAPTTIESTKPSSRRWPRAKS